MQLEIEDEAIVFGEGEPGGLQRGAEVGRVAFAHVGELGIRADAIDERRARVARDRAGGALLIECEAHDDRADEGRERAATAIAGDGGRVSDEQAYAGELADVVEVTEAADADVGEGRRDHLGVELGQRGIDAGDGGACEDEVIAMIAVELRSEARGVEGAAGPPPGEFRSEIHVREYRP